jgi:hypothetical protein
MKHKRRTAGYTWTEYKTKQKKKKRRCKKTKYNPSFGQNTRIQKKLVATYKQNAP